MWTITNIAEFQIDHVDDVHKEKYYNTCWIHVCAQ